MVSLSFHYSSLIIIINIEFFTENNNYLINLIDSPGHVDFCGEVSTAVRLCDGAIIVVDVVEGVCSQTKSALQQAWIEGIKPILVLNKIDRLFLEMKLNCLDIYVHLQQILEQLNAFLGELLTTDVLSNCNDISNENNSFSEKDAQKTYNWSSGLDDIDDSSVYFSPEHNNVIFASALDGWGFSIKKFSNFLSEKHGIKQNVLNTTLWGDFYLNKKEKKILKGAQSKAKKPLFVTMILENIYSIYDVIYNRRDKEMIGKLVTSLNIKLTNRDLNHSDPKSQLHLVMSQWLSLSESVLCAVCENIPSPKDLSEQRVERLMCTNTHRFDSLPSKTQQLKQDLLNCSSDSDAPTIICVSKMFSIERKFLPQFRSRPMTYEEIIEKRNQVKNNRIIKEDGETQQNQISNEETMNEIDEIDEVDTSNDHVFIAFARIFSGTIKRGDKVYVLGPKHDPSQITDSTVISEGLTIDQLSSSQHVTTTVIQQLYLMMGKELESLDSVPAGNIFGIGGLEQHILKSATLSNTLYFPPFIDLHLSAVPILRVALEPQNPIEMPKLIKGLKLLNQADPCVEVKLGDFGEHIIITTGEVHLERCIDDLIQRFAGIEINYSSPIVPFRETIVHPPKLDMVNELITNSTVSSHKKDHQSSVELWTPNKNSKIKIQAKPMPPEVRELLCENSKIFKLMTQYQRDTSGNSFSQKQYTSQVLNAIDDLRTKIKQAFKEGGWDDKTVDKIWSFGPKYSGPNLLINYIPDYNRPNNWFIDDHLDSKHKADKRQEFDNSFVSGFQLATLAGPLCEEPLMGVCFIVEEWVILDDLKLIQNDTYGPFSGQIMSIVKECCRKAFQAQPQRLMAAMYSCNIQVDSDALGKFIHFISLYVNLPCSF